MLTLVPPPRRLPRYLTQDHLQRFFAAITSVRDRALFALIYHHGLRVGEVSLLRVADLDLERRRIVVRRLKGGAWGEQLLFPATQELLRRYLDAERPPEDGPLFPGRLGPLKKRQIQARFVHYRTLADLPSTHGCHSLRHSIATHLLDAGVSLEFVQDHLGHQSIRSTSIYARITDRRRAEVFRQLEVSPAIVQPDAAIPAPSRQPPKESFP